MLQIKQQTPGNHPRFLRLTVKGEVFLDTKNAIL